MRERIGGISETAGENVLDGQTITGLRTPARLVIRAFSTHEVQDPDDHNANLTVSEATVVFQSGRVQLVNMPLGERRWRTSRHPLSTPASDWGIGILNDATMTDDDIIWDGIVPAGNLTLEFDHPENSKVTWDLTAF